MLDGEDLVDRRLSGGTLNGIVNINLQIVVVVAWWMCGRHGWYGVVDIWRWMAGGSEVCRHDGNLFEWM